MKAVFVCRYNTLPSRRTLKNSRLVSKKDDVHVCIMCLRAIMNYQVFPFAFFCAASLFVGGRERLVVNAEGKAAGKV